MTVQKRTYDASSISHLSSVEAVRQKASMYLGELGEAMVFTTLRETLDNVVDEALNGRAKTCHTYVAEDGSYYVLDDGQGMPVGPMKVEDSVTGKTYTVSSLYAITGLLHAGGKLQTSKDSAYEVSRGSHGIGIKGTNFVSRFFSVCTFFKGQWWNIEYQNGRVTTEVNKMAKPPAHPWLKGALKSGTMVHFKPDPKIVNGEKFPLSMYGEWAKIAAYFTPGLTVTLTDFKGREKSWCFPEGPARYVTDRIAQLKCSPIEADKAPFTFTSPFADVVVQWTDYDGCDFQAFTNGLNNPDKGVHFSAFFSALQVALDPYAGKKHKFGAAELREGVVGLVNAKLSAPKFSSQTKDKMVDERADKPLHDALKVALSAFFAKNKKFAETICARADQLRSLKSQFTASKKVLTVLAKARSKGLPAKCSSAPNCKPEARELYVVEGESAGGSCRNARDPKYQEILPLKGKIMSAFRAKQEIILLSEEVVNILTMLGFDAKAVDPLARLRVRGGLFLLADPDPDGSHINSLLLALIYRFMPGMFDLGLVYIVDAPEWFAVNKKGEMVYGSTKVDLQAKLAERKESNLAIRHIKGYGELDAKLLRILAFDPATRMTTRITTENAKSVARFVALMSDDVQARRDLLGV